MRLKGVRRQGAVLAIVLASVQIGAVGASASTSSSSSTSSSTSSASSSAEAAPAMRAGKAVGIVGDCRTAQVRPDEVILDCYDGETAIDVKRWKRYTVRKAVGSARLWGEDVTARFYRPRARHAGEVDGRVFTRLSISGSDHTFRLVRDSNACCGWDWR